MDTPVKTTDAPAARNAREHHFLLTPFLLTLPVVFILFVLIWGSQTAGSDNADALPENIPAVNPPAYVNDTLKAHPFLQ